MSSTTIGRRSRRRVCKSKAIADRDSILHSRILHTNLCSLRRTFAPLVVQYSCGFAQNHKISTVLHSECTFHTEIPPKIMFFLLRYFGRRVEFHQRERAMSLNRS